MDWASPTVPDDGIPWSFRFADRIGLLADVEGRLRTKRGFTIATMNLDHLVKLRRDAAFRRAYRSHSHVTADGNPVVWLERLSGRSAELVPGSDLVIPIVEKALDAGAPVALIGSTPASLEGAAIEMQRQAPGLNVVLRRSPKSGFDPNGPEADELIASIRQSGAKLCFLALGAPKQELFASRASSSLGSVGFVSVGAGLDFLSGAQQRAPAAMRGAAMEWAWRLGSNPKRLTARYMKCAVLLVPLTGTALWRRIRRLAA